MIPLDKTDPISQFVSSVDLEPISTYNNLLAWKFATIKNSAVTNFDLSSFIKIKDSNYLLHINLFYSYNKLYAIWDIEKGKGWILDSSTTANLNLKNAEFSTYAVQNITEVNSAIFENSKAKSFDDKCLDMLKALASSKEHANKSSEELAVKAIKLVVDLNNQLNSVKSMYS